MESEVLFKTIIRTDATEDFGTWTPKARMEKVVPASGGKSLD